MIDSDSRHNGNPASPPSEKCGEALLSSAYFAPIQWYQKLNRYDTCLIEQHDHFVKQTYRNRLPTDRSRSRFLWRGSRN